VCDRNTSNEKSAEAPSRPAAHDIEHIVSASMTVFGWRNGEALAEIALASWRLRSDATIVESGVFMGRSTALLAGARRLRGSGKVHCVDPFDCSGDAFSIPHYLQALKDTGDDSLEEVFRRNMARLGIERWIELHKGRSQDLAARWSRSIDLLLLDGDQSPTGAREAYEAWMPHLRRDGIIIMGNVHLQPNEGHDGNSRLAVEEVIPPRYSGIRRVGSTVFAVKEF
jgi:predicted O-methyltransferase YrrM